jgi:hypothetical protein
MQPHDHPALRPTRYHWAAGTNPYHWVPALGAWMAAIMLGATAGLSAELRAPLLGIVPLLMLAALAWTGWWLVGVPMLPRFRRATDAKLLAQYEGDYDFQLADLRERIDADLRDKVQDIGALRNQARKMLSGKFDESDPFARDNLAKLDRLAINYLQLLAALTEHANYLSLVTPDAIQQDLAKASAELDAVDGAALDQDDNIVLAARQKQVELLQSRLERYKKALQRRELIKAQCMNVETTMKLLVDQAMTAKDAQRVGRDIDQVLSNIKESELLSEELGQLDALSSTLTERTH